MKALVLLVLLNTPKTVPRGEPQQQPDVEYCSAQCAIYGTKLISIDLNMQSGRWQCHCEGKP